MPLIVPESQPEHPGSGAIAQHPKALSVMNDGRAVPKHTYLRTGVGHSGPLAFVLFIGERRAGPPAASRFQGSLTTAIRRLIQQADRHIPQDSGTRDRRHRNARENFSLFSSSEDAFRWGVSVGKRICYHHTYLDAMVITVRWTSNMQYKIDVHGSGIQDGKEGAPTAEVPIDFQPTRAFLR
jgi:hypothetical protein